MTALQQSSQGVPLENLEFGSPTTVTTLALPQTSPMSAEDSAASPQGGTASPALWSVSQPPVDATSPDAVAGVSAEALSSEAAQGPPADNLIVEGSSRMHLWLRRLTMTPGPLHVHYPMRFRILATAVLVLSILWLVHFITEVLPWSSKRVEPVCEYHYEQLGQNGVLLFVYFICFAQVRIAIFFPRVASCVADLSSRRRNPCHMYCVHMLVHGALYFFSIGSVLYWCQLLQSPYCHAVHIEHHHVLTRYAMFSCIVSISCLWLVYWHTKLLNIALREHQSHARRAPPNTIRKLRSVAYDPNLFGSEDGKFYGGECPICLSDWEDGQMIKVTPCEHVFHEECLAMWLSSQRTCAVCRHDLTKPATPVRSPRAKPDAVSPQSTQAPQVVGIQIDAMLDECESDGIQST